MSAGNSQAPDSDECEEFAKWMLEEENVALKKENLELKEVIQNNLQKVASYVQQFMIDRIAEGETTQKVLSEIKYDILRLSVTSQPSSQLVIDRGQVLSIVERYIND